MKTRTSILVGAAAGLATLGVGSVAHAHTFSATPSCSGLAWAARDFQDNPNRITVTIDGAVAYSDASFGTTDIGSIPWTQFANHSWSIVVDAPGTAHDYSPSGIQQACQTTTTTEETTTSTSTTTTTTPDTTSSTSPTTTDPATTTTSVPGSTQPPTTSSTPGVASTLPSSTSPTPSTPTGTIPRTGNSSGDLLLVALFLIGMGAIATAFARRA